MLFVENVEKICDNHKGNILDNSELHIDTS